MVRFSMLLLLATAATAAPWTREKLALVPGLYPDERRALAGKVLPLIARGEDPKPALLEAGLDPGLVARLDELHPGPLLVERYAHNLVKAAPGLTPQQEALFKHLLPSVTAGQWALWIQRERMLKDLEPDAVQRQRISNSFDRQIREIEKRFWTVMNYALTTEQRAAIHKLMPQPYQRPPDISGHLYQLPDLTPSQAARVRALLTEYESETAADAAEIRRLQAALGAAPAEERAEMQRRIDAATDRAGDVLRNIVAVSRKVLTEEQYRYLDALPPLLRPQDRAQHPGVLLQQMGLTPEQRKALEPLGAEIRRAADEARGRADQALDGMEGEMGTDAPQSMTMQMVRQAAATRARLVMEKAGHEAVIGILDPKQVLGWILSPR